jgi:hypothetical protein
MRLIMRSQFYNRLNNFLKLEIENNSNHKYELPTIKNYEFG